MYQSSLLFVLCSVLGFCEAQVACDIRLLYSRLLADAALADSFCTDFLEGPHLSTQFLQQFGLECYDAHRAELSMGCSIFAAAKRVLQPVTSTTTATATATVTVTASETVTVKDPAYSEILVTPSTIYDPSPTPYLYVSLAPDQSIAADEPAPTVLSSLTSTTTSTFSSMTGASISTTLHSTLSTTTIPVMQSTISSLAAPIPSPTGRCVPTPLPAAVDHHVFTPLVDLSLEQSWASGAAATTVDDPHDPNSVNCGPHSVVYLPEQASASCVHLTGSWTPLYTDVYYECVARTRAPNFDPTYYPDGVAGFNFTATDDSFSVVNARPLGPRPERDYQESSLTLFVPKEKTYVVDFWACGAGTTLIIGELSCTYYG
ncbi:hypothetical protein A1O3_05838 [Capronia epimyces CBS 606.96]|uniref:PA14 domain-containing protein n=1 Tax=Capronia epimyces CBS 606.96 TaxID=1182542 RepID=W9XY34_9EURO|nr:uncharacterized protein A1O3_05838 [Capronia epimyces CBS 606.96]EXJ85163.1 hypothetical protein A1O3_05838 [Capronia epimyces CBS 606.96]